MYLQINTGTIIVGSSGRGHGETDRQTHRQTQTDRERERLFLAAGLYRLQSDTDRTNFRAVQHNPDICPFSATVFGHFTGVYGIMVWDIEQLKQK